VLTQDSFLAYKTIKKIIFIEYLDNTTHKLLISHNLQLI